MSKMSRSTKRSSRANPRTDRNDNVIDFNNSTENNKGKRTPRENKKVVKLLPRNLAQEEYVDALQNTQNTIVFSVGPAGTGKTLMATLYAIDQLQKGYIDKILITRPTVSVEESYGFLKGSLIEKLQPWVIPIIDIFQEYYGVHGVEKMLADNVIEIAPLGFARGRTFKNCIVIFDETQNASVNQMKMMLTRIGENCRLFATGDLKQHDAGYEQNGLRDFIHRLERKKSNMIQICYFSRCDIERHPIVAEVLSIYGEED